MKEKYVNLIGPTMTLKSKKETTYGIIRFKNTHHNFTPNNKKTTRKNTGHKGSLQKGKNEKVNYIVVLRVGVPFSEKSFFRTT